MRMMNLQKTIAAGGLSIAAFIALTVFLKPGCELVSVEMGNAVSRVVVIVLLPCLAVGIFSCMLYDLLSFATFRFSRQRAYDDVVMAAGSRTEWTSAQLVKILLLYPPIIGVWAAIAVVWLTAINCESYRWAPGVAV